MITTQDENTLPPAPPVEGEETFEQFADTLPDTAQGFLESVQADSQPSLLDSAIAEEAVQEKKTKTVKMSKKMKKAMDKLKSKSANLPILWFHQQAKVNPEWELDEEEKELITDSIETVFELLDINIEIMPWEMTLTSIWWVVGYPVLAFVFLFLTKKSMIIDRENQERQEG